jgi:glyoxylase-like metal-dependent hydrolase (beta-lactamase superfamily II)
VKVHHLNCGTMHPRGGPTMVCHVLLVEAPDGLVLVDTGHGSHDCDDPARRIGPARFFFRPVLDHNETAVRQVERLGFSRTDVRHIVVTHFDMDHTGGIADFPEAQIHVTSAEVLAATQRQSMNEKGRYRPAQWAHGPKLVEHNPDGEKWRGFAAAKELDEISAGMVMVSLPGHTRGHTCVAVDAGHRWILHCGDAFYHPGTVDGRSQVPGLIRTLEPILAVDRKQVRDNHARLAELYQRQEPDLLVVCAHDASLYERAKATA